MEIKEKTQILYHHLKEINELDKLLTNPLYKYMQNTTIKNHTVELNRLKKYLLQVIYNNQNPKDCKKAKYLICPLKACGFGCSLHHYFHCFNYALYSNRVVYFEFEKDSKYKEILQPSSDKCKLSEIELSNLVQYTPNIDAQYVKYIIVDYLEPEEYFPTTIPLEIASEIQKYHEFPFLWYCGVVQNYILRLKNEAKSKMEKFENFLKNKDESLIKEDSLLKNHVVGYFDFKITFYLVFILEELTKLALKH